MATKGKALDAVSAPVAQETTHLDPAAGTQPAPTPNECFEKLQAKAAKQRLSLYRQPCLSPEFGSEVFTISGHKEMVTLDSLPQVDAWLSARPTPI